jgi:hypothetical protein
MDDFVPHRIQNQLDGGMKFELDNDIAAMGFCRFYCYAWQRRDFLGSLALTNQLHDLSLPER